MGRGAFGAAVLLSLAVLFVPAGGVPSAPPGTDKLVHLALFAALAFTGRWAGVPTWRLALLLAVYAPLTEAVQALAPLGRSASAGDVLADLLGAALGLWLWRSTGRR